MTDVLDRIDDLIAEEKCPHCERGFHQLPLTQKIDQMFRAENLEPYYFSGEDRSPILCDGSTFIGPLRPALPIADFGPFIDYVYTPYAFGSFAYSSGAVLSIPWVHNILEYINSATLQGMSFGFQPWLHEAPKEPVCDSLPDIAVEFGSQNWVVSEIVKPEPYLQSVVAAYYWNDMIKHDFPIPESSGFDFSQYDTDMKYPKDKYETIGTARRRKK